MDLSKMSPKEKGRYEVAMESKQFLLSDLKQDVIPEDYEDVIHAIGRAEYKRGKADGSAESVQDTNKKGCGKPFPCNLHLNCFKVCSEKEGFCKECSSNLNKESSE